jgi:hypothetical protein
MSVAQELFRTTSSARHGEFVHGLQKLATVTCHRGSYAGNDSGWSSSTPAPARVKILNPITSSGSSMHAEIVSSSQMRLVVRVPRGILIGSTVRIRMGENVAFGEVHSSNAVGSQFEIGVEVQRSS